MTAMKQRNNRPTALRSTRRNFLRSTAVAIAAPTVIGSTALGAPGSRPASERITTALIGSGSRGRQIIAGGDQVVAVCDVDASHRAAAKKQIDQAAGSSDCRAYGDFREVLARDDIDAVVVATPDHWHAYIAAMAVKAGKSVYCEKPLTRLVHEGRQLSDIATRYNAILQVGSQQRSDEKFIRACELVRNGRLGELKRVLVEIPTRPGIDNDWRPRKVPAELDYEMWLGPAPYSPYHPARVHYKFRFVSDFSGGDVTNWGAHQLDIVQLALGADDGGPTMVVGRGKRNIHGIHDVFYDVNVDFTYPGGVPVQLRSGGNFVRFEGSEGTITVSREKLEAEPATLLASPIGPDEIHLPRPAAEEGGTHMGTWLHAVRTGNRSALNAPVEVGHRSATVCHLANLAMEIERPLRWDAQAEQFVDDPEANRLLTRATREPWSL